MPTQKKKIYRAGVIGCGAIAQECHLPGYAENKQVELVACTDPSAARHAEIQETYPGIHAYTDHREMLAKESLDIVSVCSPNKFHAAQAIAALNAKCHVLCEKPMATTLKEADRMIEAARNARKKLMIGFTHRLFSGPIACKDLLAKRRIGKPFMIRVRMAHGGPYPGWAKHNWFYNKELSAGGVLLDMGIHAIDQCLWLMGPIVSVQAITATLVKKIPVDDNALLLLEFKSGALGYIDVGWTSKPGFTGLEIYGSKGSIICDYVRGLQLCEGELSPSGEHTHNWQTLEENPIEGGWPVEIPHWIDVITGEERLTSTGKAGRAALEIALAAYKSSKSGKRVAVGPAATK